MRLKYRSIQILFACLLVMTQIAPVAAAQYEENDRLIYIGDHIELEIQDPAISKLMIEEAFKAFDILEIEPMDEGYQVVMTIMEPGEWSVELGGQTIVFKVASTLDTIERDTLFEKDLDIHKGANKTILFILLGIVFLGAIISNGFWLFKRRKKKVEKMSAYEAFDKNLDQLSSKDSYALGKMTGFVKEYLSLRLGVKLEGLTTSQLETHFQSNTARGIFEEEPFRNFIQWLKDCDSYKYSDVLVDEATINTLRESLKSIVSGMEEVIKYNEEVKDAV